MCIAHVDVRIGCREWYPYFDRPLELKVVRQDADNLIVGIIEMHRLADGIFSAAEPSLPETICDHGHLVATLDGFLGQKIAAPHRFNSERWEE
jgi:hypothetical protein